MTIEPIIYHRPSRRFRQLALTGYDFAGPFKIGGINGYSPFASFDPGARMVYLMPLYSIAASWAQIESRTTNPIARASKFGRSDHPYH
jgi:hypothetical protein